MSNTSATGGYLLPTDSVSDGPTLENQIHGAIAGMTGLGATMIRPAWQPDPPAKPDGNVNWCAFRVTEIVPEWTGAIIHHPEGDGTDELRRHVTVSVLCSFYGPDSIRIAEVFRDGILIPQNMEALASHNIAFLEAGRLFSAPDVVNNQWIKRQDLTVQFRRMVSRTYQVNNLLGAEVTTKAENGNTNHSVSET